MVNADLVERAFMAQKAAVTAIDAAAFGVLVGETAYQELQNVLANATQLATKLEKTVIKARIAAADAEIAKREAERAALQAELDRLNTP